MSHVCPHCHSELTNDGPHRSAEPISPEAPADSAPESDSRFPFWTALPWCLFGAATLLLLPHLRHPQTPAVPPSSAPAAALLTVPTLPSTLPMSPAETPGTRHVPLTVTLYSAAAGRHIPLGAPVVISAYAALASGRSATLTIFYSKDNGPKSLLSLAQGSFSSTAWTPTAPGRYKFTASALDSRKTSAFSPHVSLRVDAPVAAHDQTVSLPPAEPHHAAAGRQSVKHHPSASPATPVSTASLPYRVAAAAFPVRHIAETLAGALRHRGFQAFVRASASGQGRQTYAVETGDFFHQADAQKQMRLLQRDGYPAYLFRLR